MFGGPGEAVNLTAMRNDVNSRGNREYYNMEMEWREIIEGGGTVNPQVEISYPDGSTRPEGYYIVWTDESGADRESYFIN